MKLIVKLVFMFIFICTILEIKGLTGWEIYQHLSKSDNKDIQNICENDICSDSTSFFRNKLFHQEDFREIFNRLEIRNEKLESFQKIILKYKNELQEKKNNKYEEQLNDLKNLLKETEKKYDDIITNVPLQNQNAKLYNYIRKLIEEKNKNLDTYKDEELRKMEEKIKQFQEKYYDVSGGNLKNEIIKIKEEIIELKKNRENQQQYLRKEKDNDTSIENLESKIIKLKENYSKEELLLNKENVQKVCSEEVINYFNKGYMINIEIKPDHHFVIIKESQDSENVSIFQAFAKFYTLNKWMNHYFSKRINNINNINQFCKLFYDVISSNSTEAITLLFSINEFKNVEEIKKYLMQNSERITLKKSESLETDWFYFKKKKKNKKVIE